MAMKPSELLSGTFHRRELKPPALSFSSVEGKAIFREALKNGTAENYFALAEHYMTQGHPAFCGVASLTMALNALLLDPHRVWQGVWRWFDESMLDCCESLDVMRLKGTTLSKLACVARCNGAETVVKYGSALSLDEFRQDVVSVCTGEQPGGQGGAGRGGCCSPHEEAVCAISSTEGTESSTSSPHPDVGSGKSSSSVMIVSYCRKNLNQTGSGHFSPVGGYHSERDLVLVMDVARFKYPPHWVPLQTLWEAMCELDPDSQRSRGYMLLRASAKLRGSVLESCCCRELPVAIEGSAESAEQPANVKSGESCKQGGTPQLDLHCTADSDQSKPLNICYVADATLPGQLLIKKRKQGASSPSGSNSSCTTIEYVTDKLLSKKGPLFSVNVGDSRGSDEQGVNDLRAPTDPPTKIARVPVTECTTHSYEDNIGCAADGSGNDASGNDASGNDASGNDASDGLSRGKHDGAWLANVLNKLEELDRNSPNSQCL